MKNHKRGGLLQKSYVMAVNSTQADLNASTAADQDTKQDTDSKQEETDAKQEKANKKQEKADKKQGKQETGQDKNQKDVENEETREGSLAVWKGQLSEALSSHPVYAAAGIVVLIAIILGAVLCIQRRRRRSRTGQSKEAAEGGSAYMQAPAAPLAQQPIGMQEPQAGIYVSKVHQIGSRESQQDSFGMSQNGPVVRLDEEGLCAVVADGMGGLSGGDKTSALTVMTMMQTYDQKPMGHPDDQWLLHMLNTANREVNAMIQASGGQRSGSTVVSVIIRDGKLSWLTVGDSHLYMYRDGALMQVNRDHVYGVDLDEQAARGEISLAHAAQDPQRKALTSYIGMGEIEKIDRNIRPLTLKSYDRIVLMTDGVFGTLTEEEITEALQQPIEAVGDVLDAMIREKHRPSQDNYTALILEYVQ